MSKESSEKEIVNIHAGFTQLKDGNEK